MFVCVFACFPFLFPPQRVSSLVHIAVLVKSLVHSNISKASRPFQILCMTSSLAFTWPFNLILCIMCVCVFLRGEAILLPALPIPSLSEREPKDARPECPPYAFWQQPVPRHKEFVAEPGGARSAGCQTPTNATTTIDHLIDPDLDQISQGITQPQKHHHQS